MIELKSDLLRVFVLEPGEAPNNTFRFNRAGAVAEILHNGRNTFCASEPNHLWHLCSGGRGLMNEFTMDVSGEVGVGEYFPKLGVGLLKKPDGELYRFYRKYEYQPFPITWEQDGSSVTFVTEPLPCAGYAARMTKTLRVEGNGLYMRDTLENVGEKTISTTEYGHNFLTINGLAIGPAYFLDLPDMTERPDEIIKGTMKGCGRSLTYAAYLHDAVSFDIDAADITGEGSFRWAIRNTDASYARKGEVSVSVTEYFVPVKVSLWTVDHLVTLMPHHQVVLRPGGKEAWERRYTFDEIQYS